jgi:CHAT domain-containing protein
VVVANPRAADALRVQQRLSDLPQGGTEGLRWAAVQRNVLMLADSSATRQRLLGVWQQAGSLYFATHALQHPEIPYLQSIPLASDGPSTPGGDVLGVTDIRHADLSGCRLVVLSACQSGARYLAGQAQGSSLADAFLDAGAAVVVYTLWPVRDEAARRVMDEFAAAWSANAENAVAALNAALHTCAAQMDSTGADDPRPLEWAAYGVQVRGWSATHWPGTD